MSVKICEKCQQVIVTRPSTGKQLPAAMLAGLEKLLWRRRTGKVWRWLGWDHMEIIRGL